VLESVAFSHLNWCWCDRHRCWKRLGSESLESRLLFRRQSHFPGNLAVQVHRQRDASCGHALLHELGVGARFTVKGDERAPEIVLADACDPQRLQRGKEMPAADVLRV